MTKKCNTCKRLKELNKFYNKFNKCAECCKKEYKIKNHIPLDKDISPRPEQTISEDFLCNLNIKENIYLLGLLWADGYVNKNRKNLTYVCTSDDFIYSVNIFRRFGAVNTYEYKPKKRNKKNNGIQINDERVYRFLAENDYLIKSGASPDKILSLIPENLKYYWWRGYFDGDGGTYIDSRSGREVVSINFSSCFKQNWNFVIKLFNELIIQKYTIRKGEKKRKENNIIKLSHFSEVYITKSNEVYKFFNYIYPNMKYDGLGYKRKFYKLMAVNNTFGKTRTNKYEGIRRKGNKWIIFVKKDGKTKTIGSDINENNAYKRQQQFLLKN